MPEVADPLTQKLTVVPTVSAGSCVIGIKVQLASYALTAIQEGADGRVGGGAGGTGVDGTGAGGTGVGGTGAGGTGVGGTGVGGTGAGGTGSGGTGVGGTGVGGAGGGVGAHPGGSPVWKSGSHVLQWTVLSFASSHQKVPFPLSPALRHTRWYVPEQYV